MGSKICNEKPPNLEQVFSGQILNHEIFNPSAPSHPNFPSSVLISATRMSSTTRLKCASLPMTTYGFVVMQQVQLHWRTLDFGVTYFLFQTYMNLFHFSKYLSI